MTAYGDAVADCVLNAFKELPSKAKPRQHPDGRREWVPLSGIVLSKGFFVLINVGDCVIDTFLDADGSHVCVSLGSVPLRL